MGAYLRLAAMLGTSTLSMYFLTFLNTNQLDHIHFSQTRVWMALLMGAAMTFVMLGFMRDMYQDKRRNVLAATIACMIFGAALWLVRSQRTVDDVAYMRAMIPHHSIAILTSERARIGAPEVRRLADGIIATQRKEIGEMEALIAKLEGQQSRQ